jgi:formamidopyrimidine-DNA glycosylase
LVEPKGKIEIIGNKSSHLILDAHQELSGALLITAEKRHLQNLNTPVIFELRQGEKVIKSFKSSFLGPAQ